MTNGADPDQLASSEANWSGSTLLAKTGHIVFSKRRVKMLTSTCAHSFASNLQLSFLNQQKCKNDYRNECWWSISKLCGRAGIRTCDPCICSQLATHCSMEPGFGHVNTVKTHITYISLCICSVHKSHLCPPVETLYSWLFKEHQQRLW